MVTRTERIRLGIFLVLGLVLGATFLFFTVGRAWFEKNDLYTIAFTESVSGLNIGNPVKMRGVAIGKVEDLSFDLMDSRRIIVTISVRKGIRIRSDAEAVVEVFGITGLKFIDIGKGSNTAPALQPGDRIPSGVSAIGMVTGKAEDIAAKIEVALNNIIAFTGPENLDDVRRAFTDIGQLSRNLNALVAENRVNITAFTSSLSGQTGGVAGRANTVLTHLDSVVSDFERTLGDKSILKSARNIEAITDKLRENLADNQLGKTIANVNRALDNTNVTVTEFNRTLTQTRDRLNKTLDRLEATTRNLADFTQKIKENPSLLIRKQED